MSFCCPIVTLDSVDPHPNADRLDLATIKGWRAVVQRGLHRTGESVVYVPTDAVLPPAAVAYFGYTGKLAGPDKNRVKTVKLRGEVSQGLVLPVDKVFKYLHDTVPHWLDRSATVWQLGADLAELLGVTKYEPPIPIHMQGEVTSAPDWFRVHYDIENIKNWPGVIAEGDIVVFTEKIHGTHCRVGYHRDQGFFVGSRNSHRSIKHDPTNLYWRAALDHGLEERLRAAVVTAEALYVVVFGEVFGRGVQDLHYGLEPNQVGFRAFDVQVDGVWTDEPFARVLLTSVGIATVPKLFHGEFSAAELQHHTNGRDFSDSHVREGVVVRPERERNHPQLGRVILKSISPDYELRRGGTEYH